jgi:hypothetical protein
MPGSVVETYKEYDRRNGRPEKVVANLACIGDSANGTLPDTALSAALMSLIFGMYLRYMVTIPSTPAPTASYDITLVGDTSTLDLLGGAGADRSDSAAEQVMPIISTTAQKRLITENLTFKVAAQAVHSAVFSVQLIFTRN